jgi:hypothetical protein
LASASALAVSSSAASSLAVAAHWQPPCTSPQAPPLLPTTTMPLALLSLRPQPMLKTCTLARWWPLKACASGRSRTVPVNPLQPPRCCHRTATIALCAAAALCADAAAAAKLPPTLRCCTAATVADAATAAALPPSRCAPPHCPAAATAADAAAAAMPPPSFRRRRAGALRSMLQEQR